MSTPPITELLQRVHAGDQQALHTVIPLVYDELKKLAAGHLRRESEVPPLDTTALVHEAFLRLAHRPAFWRYVSDAGAARAGGRAHNTRWP